LFVEGGSLLIYLFHKGMLQIQQRYRWFTWKSDFLLARENR